ncbi:hypothetical protein BN946_scf184674.g8 [Trametes cinnabarina]|uniref:Uncharacterized protein n=1 Tax=Pycnoporus cinnabarinus TaxID=5643 RepID=A0A060SVY1_PYCCI|nr:hypothetical protein BN946_scf184674.g8 [Trametes cinnabarina]
MQEMDIRRSDNDSSSSGAVYHVPQLEQFVRDWNAAESASARMEVYKRQKAVVASREEYAHLLEKWWQNRKRNRAQELEALKTQRLSDISDRLTRLGWGDEIRRLCDTDEGRAKLRRINSVFQPAKLTDKTFENVRRNMTELLTETRNTLAKEKRQATLSNNLKLLTTALEAHYVQIPRTPRMLCRPYVADILFEPEIKAALTSSTADLLTAQDLASVTLTVCQRWEELVKQELRAMVRAEVGDIDDDIDPLQLAVAFFSCSRCHNAALRYPEVLAHRCRLDYERLWPEPVDQYVLDVHSVTFIGLRNGSFIRPLGLGAARLAPGVKELLTALGMPPTTTTVKQLMQDDVRFRRLDDGKYPGDDRKVHTWIGVVGHSSLRFAMNYPHASVVQSRCFKARWRLATAEELDAISQLALESHTPGIHDLRQGIPWVCALCSREWSGYCDQFEVEQHLQSMHNLEDVRVEQCVKDGTIFLHPGHAYSDRPIPLPDAPDSV